MFHRHWFTIILGTVLVMVAVTAGCTVRDGASDTGTGSAYFGGNIWTLPVDALWRLTL